MGSKRALWLAVALPLADVNYVEAALTTNSWVGFSGKWEDGAHWSAGVPSSANAVNVLSNVLSGTATIDTATVTQHVINGCMTISNLVVGGVGRTLFLNNANNTPGNIGLTIINQCSLTSGGNLLITNSDMKVIGAPFGAAVFNDGTILLNTGTLIVTQDLGYLVIGKLGTGTMSISNGTLRAGYVEVPTQTGARGTLNIAGGTNLFRNLNVGFNRTGTVWVTGGFLTVSGGTNIVGGSSSGSAEMIVSNATWTAGVAILRTAGTLTVAGGTNNLASLQIAEFNTSTSAVWVTGGQLTVTNDITFIGKSGIGQMAVSNGTWRAGAVYVGNTAGSSGTLNVAGGTNSIASTFYLGSDAGASGTVWMTGGQLTSTNSGVIVGSSGVGQLTVSNGNWTAQFVNVAGGNGSKGTLTVAGGTNRFTSSFYVAGGAGTAAVWLTDGELITTNAETSIGLEGLGLMTVSNGTWRARAVFLGGDVGTVGTLTVAGGTSIVTSNMTLGNSTCTATGIVKVTGGSLFVTNTAGDAKLFVLTGTFTQSGGLVNIRNLILTNACGRFIHTGGTLTTGLIIIDPSLDADGDGMTNGFELAFGLDFLDPTDAGEDPDGDGLTNLQEQQFGTNPNVNDFHITAITREGNDIRITWATVGGTTNRVLVSTGAADGSYTNKFKNLSPIIFVAGSGAATTNYLDTGGATNAPSRYYTVVRGLGFAGVRFLFDADHGESAGNADWVIDADLHNLTWNSSGTFTISGNDSNAQRIPTPAASTITPSSSETNWTGALSAWAIDLVKRGHSVETLPAGTTLTFNTANSQDLTNYDVVVIDEPNVLFAMSEKQALLSFVSNGGSLFMISDHVVSDRNGDGQDSVSIWNDFLTNNLVTNNPFGIIFRSAGTGSNGSGSNTFSRSIVGNPILNGPVGVATNMEYFNGNEFQIDNAKNPTAVSHMWFGTLGDSNNFCGLATLQYVNGRVVVVGDSSCIEDGTGDPGDSLFNGYTLDAGGVQHIWILNASEWLAAPFQ